MRAVSPPSDHAGAQLFSRLTQSSHRAAGPHLWGPGCCPGPQQLANLHPGPGNTCRQVSQTHVPTSLAFTFSSQLMACGLVTWVGCHHQRPHGGLGQGLFKPRALGPPHLLMSVVCVGAQEAAPLISSQVRLLWVQRAHGEKGRPGQFASLPPTCRE